MSVFRAAVTLTVVAVFTAFAVGSAHAQATGEPATIIGKVTSQTQQPIAGAAIVLSRLRLSAQTNEAGVYRLNIPADRVGGEDTLRVTRIGYGPRFIPIQIRPGSNGVDVVLSEKAVALNEVVVTGTAGNQERRAQPAVVASVDASTIMQAAPITNVNQLLTGRVTGVSVTQTNGSVGQTSVIRIRGVSSISLSNDPLIFVDGKRVDNRNVSVAGGSVSTLNDIDPSTIESIEVVKGPAAATLYGADASAGVIQIITKKGVVGASRFSQGVTAEYGTARANWTPPTNYATCSATDVVATSAAVICHGKTAGTIVNDNPIVREKLLRDGEAKTLRWQGRGGGGNYGYFLAYGYQQESATVPANDVIFQNTRANFTILPRSDLTIDAGFGLARDINNQLNVGDNIYGLLTALIGNPLTVGTPTNGWFAPNRGGLAIASIENKVTTTRFDPNITTRYTPLPWFTHRLTLGADINRMFYHNFFPKNDIGWYAGNNNTGLVREDRNAFDTWTLDYLGDIKRDFRGGTVTADFSFGSQVIARLQDSLTATGYGLATNASNTVSAATTISAGGGRSEQRFVGYLGQLQLGYRDRLFLQFGARVDQNSSFANKNETFFLPKYGVSYVISEEPFWKDHLSVVSTARLRAAYGTTGRAPTPGAALTTYSNAPYVFNNGTQGAGVVPLNPGNQKLRAEKGQEFEAGFETGFVDDRYGIDFTFFNKKTRDLLIQRPIAGSLGFTQNPYVNIGEVVNRGIELAVRGQLVTMRNVGLETRVSLTTLHNELKSLGGVAPFGTGVNNLNQYREHLPLGGWFAQRVKQVNVTDGYALVSDTTEYGGSPIPTYEGTVSSDLSLFRNFHFTGLLEFKGGHKKFNTSPYFREKAFTQEERFQRRNDPSYMSAEERIRLFGPYRNSLGATVATSAIVDDYLQDASFVRLRELAFSWTAPERIAGVLKANSASVAFGGRNLKLWTKYSGGWDPESVTYVPATGVFFAADFLTMPQPQRFFLRLNLGY